MRAYLGDMTDFLKFLELRETISLNDVTHELIRSYFASLLARGISKTSNARKVATLKSYFAWASELKLCRTDPTAKLLSPKLSKYLPEILSAEGVSKVLDLAARRAETGERKDLQNLALLELFYSSGLRVSEICSLKWPNLDFDSCVLRVVGKGSKERVAPFNRHAAAALQALRICELPPSAADELSIFLNTRFKPLGVRSARETVAQLTKAAGFSGVHPHTLRHTMATHLVDGGADIRVVQEILGHSSLATTQKYTHTSRQKLLEVYEQAFPRV